MNFDSFVLAASTADLGDEPRSREHADAVEFRMDRADAPLDSIATYDGDLPLVATNRADWEGGDAADGPERLRALAEAARNPAVEAIDVELRTLRAGEAADLVDIARRHGVAVVASVHDFERTPSPTDLRSLLADATEYGDVGKLAVTAESRGDALSLLTATHEFTEQGERVATMAMGEAGRHSRALAPLYGSRIGYAPVDPERATAPGQYDLATLAGLVEALR